LQGIAIGIGIQVHAEDRLQAHTQGESIPGIGFLIVHEMMNY
jgi:hypothetical protein